MSRIALVFLLSVSVATVTAQTSTPTPSAPAAKPTPATSPTPAAKAKPAAKQGSAVKSAAAAKADTPAKTKTPPKVAAAPIIGTGVPAKLTTPTKVTGPPAKTASGVEYWDITVGRGAEATAGKQVTVHYTGWLADGKQFRSTHDDEEPYTFKLGAGMVIKGWDEGVAGMRAGGKRQLKIPPALAYGAAGAGNLIPPNSTLIFDIELLSVK